MALGKRKYSKFARGASAGGLQRKYRRLGLRRVAYKVTRLGGTAGLGNLPYLASKVRGLYRMIETKESLSTATSSLNLPQNIVIVPINPLVVAQGTGDSMAGTANRIGDRISLKGLLIRGMFENALERSKVFYRVILTRSAKGDTINTSTLFKGNSANKMIDQVNTDRFTILASRTFTINTANAAPSTATGLGVPNSATPAGIGTRLFNLWVPGRKFGRGGNIQYEDASSVQPKFYDYRIVIMAYDWAGTPEGKVGPPAKKVIGRVNKIYIKKYFKGA